MSWPVAARDDRGTAGVELAIMAVVFLAFVAVIVYAGRLNVAHAHVESAARTGARTISLASDPHAVLDDAESEAERNVTAGSSLCTEMSFDVSPEVLTAGTEVQVEVTCHVDLSSVFMIDLPGTQTVTGTAVEVIDTYRSGPLP